MRPGTKEIFFKMSPLNCVKLRRIVVAKWNVPAGFSLVEILITMAIIGILAAALFPSVQVMRGKAQATECMANLSQISIGMKSYANDNNGSLPKMGGGGWNQEETWGYQIWPYIYGGYDQYHWRENSLQVSSAPGARAKKNVFRCPVTRTKAIGVPTANLPAAVMSYGFNSDPVGEAYNRNLSIKLARLSYPSKTLMVIESSSAPGDFQGYAQFGLMPHSGGSNMLFYDGHMEWKKYSDIPKSAADVFWDGTQE